MSHGYNKYSMSSRGRGFNSRGGGGTYRGRGGSNWETSSNGSNMSRGGYSSSRGGRFNKYSSTSYDSRHKYNSSGSSDRYSSRGGRGDHSNNYKRPRQESYSNRDDRRSSSDRKRVRNDSYQGEGSSGSQRYPSSYGGSSSTSAYNENKRSSSSAGYDDKRQSERASSYHRSEERHSSTSRNYAAPPPPRISDMAPPSQRYNSNSSNRGGGRLSRQSSNYRGRGISTRARGGNFRVGSSRTELLLSRKRALTSTLDYRRKLLSSRSRDYIQRVRLASTKIRRSGTRISGSKKESGTGSSLKDKDRVDKALNDAYSDDDDDDEDKDVEENWDVDEKTAHSEEDEPEDNEEEKKTKEDKRKKEKIDRKSNDREEIKDDEINREEDKIKHEKEEVNEVDEEKEVKIKEEAGDPDDTPNSRREGGRRFIKLTCPHCSHRSVTFKDYSLHLYSGRHNTAMRRIAARHKASLARMRVLQRQEQRRHEAREAARGTLPSRTMFCQICKLNYRSLKAVHHSSDSHRQIKRFLTPFCRVCRMQFRSPMLFETHACSLDHIKRKSLVDEKKSAGTAEADGDSSAMEDDDKDHNLENFMTLDSVGDVDAEEDEESADKKKKDKPDTENPAETEKKPKHKQMIKVGVEYIKTVEVQFCDLCKVYLPRNENSERALALHCSTRSHLKRYVRDNDDKALRRQAERIHLQTSTTTTNNVTANSINSLENVKASSTNNPQPITTSISNVSANSETSVESSIGIGDSNSGQASEQNQNSSEADVTLALSKPSKIQEEEDDYPNDGDKLWDDVDKDLGDILREVEPGKSSDDEDTR
ncbi:uncharacterized protein LOC130676698 isoform X3 [Microplitis mediator]|nr:uncharacterized protein LOC130676698 isoform X3 [Microplitis mediator]